MQKIYQGQIYSLYAQVALIDAEDNESYPQWKDETRNCALGSKGVAVATANDTEVEITVYRGKSNPDGMLCCSGRISAGSEGLLIGNVVSNDLTPLAWPRGQTLVSVFITRVDASNEAKGMVFVLDPENDETT